MLHVKRTYKDMELILAISGILDYSTVQEFNRQTESLQDADKVILDFSEMEFLDSTGIGVVLDLLHRTFENEIAFEITGLNEVAREVFDTVGVFKIVNAMGGRVTS